MLDLWLALAALSFTLVASIHFFLARRNFSPSRHMLFLALSCLLCSLIFISASQQLSATGASARWPYQEFDDERNARAMVLEHRAHPMLEVQSGSLHPGARIKSVMGQDFLSTKALIEAMDKLSPTSVITAQLWGKLEPLELILPVSSLEREGMSQGEAVAFALGLHSTGTIIWNFADGSRAVGPFAAKKSRILKIKGEDAFFTNTWRAATAHYFVSGEQPKTYYSDGESKTFSTTIFLPNHTNGKPRWGVLLPPRLALPSHFTNIRILDAPLAILAAWARFLSWDETQWRHFVRFFLDFPLAWYKIASLEKASLSFWLYHLGTSLAIFGGLALVFSPKTIMRISGQRCALVTAAVLTFLFMGKNFFVVPFV